MVSSTLNTTLQAAAPARPRCCVRIGGVSLGLSANSAGDISLSGDHAAFQIASRRCDIEVNVEWTEQLNTPQGRKLFDSGAVWTLYEGSQGFTFDFRSALLGTSPYKRLLVNQDFSEARLLLNRECLGEDAAVSAFEYPVDELLVTNYLAAGRGVELHGCSVVDPEIGGQLFVGHSGAGKSTTAGLWSSLREAIVLSDDRTIVRRRGDEIGMYGTPWHGEAGFASAREKKIERIFVLEHADKNEVSRLCEGRAAAELFARSFVPFYSHAGLGATLAYLQQVVNEVPCYRFRFLPDSSAVEAILNFYG